MTFSQSDPTRTDWTGKKNGKLFIGATWMAEGLSIFTFDAFIPPKQSN
jgi:hypothetical protein